MQRHYYMERFCRGRMITSESSDQLFAKPPKRKMHPNSLANLKPPYKPGENGHGRVYPLKERLQHQLDHPLVEPKDNAPAGERLVYATLKGAIDLVPTAFNQTWDRVEGKVPGDGVQVNFNEIKIVIVEAPPPEFSQIELADNGEPLEGGGYIGRSVTDNGEQ